MTPSTRLRLRVVPGAASSGVVGRHGEAWKVRVTAAPERGGANDAVLRLLAGALAVPARDVSVVSGRAGRDKIVLIAGIDAEEASSRLASAAREETRG